MNKDFTYRLRLTTELIQQCREIASLRGENLSALVRRYLEAYASAAATKQA